MSNNNAHESSVDSVEMPLMSPQQTIDKQALNAEIESYLAKYGNLRNISSGSDMHDLELFDSDQSEANNEPTDTITTVNGSKIYRKPSEELPYKYESSNGSILEKHDDGKWWVKDKDDEGWTAAGGVIKTYDDGVITYGGTGMTSNSQYYLGGGEANAFRLSGSFFGKNLYGKEVIATQLTKTP